MLRNGDARRRGATVSMVARVEVPQKDKSTGPPLAQIFSPSADTWLRIVLIGFVGVIVAGLNNFVLH